MFGTNTVHTHNHAQKSVYLSSTLGDDPSPEDSAYVFHTQPFRIVVSSCYIPYHVGNRAEMQCKG
jgi:hypothetical protein